MAKERKDVSRNSNPEVLEKDGLGTTGVLLSDEIEYYATQHMLIEPFNSSNLKPAGYELTLGADYAIGGKRGKLSSKFGKNELRIPPFEVAIISTGESINLPRFMIARWNLRVEWVYEGILWTGASQVDPGWTGPLFCPIYNLSNEEVILKLGEPIALMDFVKTTIFNKGKSKEYPYPPKRIRLKDYNWRLKSALFTEAAQRIKDVESRVNRMESMIGIVTTCIIILFAAISIFVTSSKQADVTMPIWVYFSVAISLIAISISFYSLFTKRLRSRLFDIIISIIISIIVVIILLYHLSPLLKGILWLK